MKSVAIGSVRRIYQYSVFLAYFTSTNQFHVLQRIYKCSLFNVKHFEYILVGVKLVFDPFWSLEKCRILTQFLKLTSRPPKILLLIFHLYLVLLAAKDLAIYGVRKLKDIACINIQNIIPVVSPSNRGRALDFSTLLLRIVTTASALR